MTGGLDIVFSVVAFVKDYVIGGDVLFMVGAKGRVWLGVVCRRSV